MVEENKFNALTPKTLEKNKPIYTKAFDYAFINDDVKNIAITGIYGAGKSSIWKTYVKERDIKDVITISLGNYNDDIDKKNINKNKSAENDSINNRIEKQIINQISSQMSNKKVPLSKFGYKENVKMKDTFLNTFFTMLFILSIIMFLNKSNLNCVEFINNLPFMNFEILCFLMFIIPILYFFMKFYRNNRFIFSKLNIKGAEVNNTKNIKDNDETVLDRDIKEIVYLIKSSGTKVVVFEDLDRYDDISIFSKLRELNFLVNANINVNSKNNENRVVRFVYMLRDSLFASKNRTKFFDFIIPVIPIVDSKNSETMLSELLGQSKSSLNDNLIRKISYYIDDMRLLKNIVNEYIIYADDENIQLEKLGLSRDKLFVLIVLKNIFPLEFDSLQEDRGYIFSVFKNAELIRQKRIKALKESKEDIQNNISELRKLEDKSKFEAMALTIPSNVSMRDNVNESWSVFLEKWSTTKEQKEVYNYNGYTSKYYNYDRFVKTYIITNEEIKLTIEKLSSDMEKEISSLNIKIDSIDLNIKKTRLLSISELLNEMDSDELNKILRSNSNDLKLENINIVNDVYFPIIKFLLLEGLIDETYWNYKGYFYEGSLGKNDQIFLMGILTNEVLDVFLKLEHPNEVFDRLESKDFSRPSILNKYLLEYCIENNKIGVIKEISDIIYGKENIQIIDVLSTMPFEIVKTYVQIIFNYKEDVLHFIIKNCENTELYKAVILSIYFLKNADVEKLKSFNEYIENTEGILEKIDEHKDYSKIFCSNIENADVKFYDLHKSKASQDILINLERIQAYRLTLSNVIYIVSMSLDEDIDYGNLISTIFDNDNFKSTTEYIKENFAGFVTDYITNPKENCDFNNSESVLIDILNENIDDKYKKEYIIRNKNSIKDLSSLENFEEKISSGIIDEIFISNNLDFTSENLNFYWDNISEYSNKFTEYINVNIRNANVDNKFEYFSKIFVDTESICNVVINNSSLSEESFLILIEFASEKLSKLNKNLAESKIAKMIEFNKLEENDYNVDLLFIKKLYKLMAKWIDSNENSTIVDIIISNKELSDKINSNLVYEFANGIANQNDTIKIIEMCNQHISINKISIEKNVVISYLLENRLDETNIANIFSDFKNFKFKDKFLSELYAKSILEKYEALYLPIEFIDYVVNSELAELQLKINILVYKIERKKELSKLAIWINNIDDISMLAQVFKKKQPNYAELTLEQKEIIDAMRSIDIVSVDNNNRIHFKPRVYANYK